MSNLVLELGPLGVFLLVLPESARVPIPSEVTLMCGCFAVRSSLMPFWLAVLAATLLPGRLADRPGDRSRWPRRDLGPRAASALVRCNRLFERHGVRAVFFARPMPLSRTFVSLPAGYSGVALGPFAALTTAGCAIWAVAFALIRDDRRHRLERVQRESQHAPCRVHRNGNSRITAVGTAVS